MIMQKLSPFAMGIFQQCRRRYKYHYIEKKIEQYKKDWPFNTMGENVHKALENFFRIDAPEGRTTEVLEKLLRAQWRLNRKGFTTIEQEREYGNKALVQLRKFAEIEDIRAKPFMLERFHEFIVDSNLKLFGKVDRIDKMENSELHLIDYKTGKMGSKSDDFQLMVYAFIVSNSLKQRVTKASYLYLEQCHWEHFEVTQESIEETLTKAKSVATAIATESEYPTNNGPLCKFCDFLTICDPGKKIDIGTDDMELPDL